MSIRHIFLLLCISSTLLKAEQNAQTIQPFDRPIPNASPTHLTTAQLAIRDQFKLQGVTDTPANADGSYDWDHRGPKNDKEWTWFLNRHRFFEDLYVTYLDTKDPTYAEKIFSILTDWIAQHKTPPAGMSFSSAWRPLEAARRILESWDIVYLKLWNDPHFPEALKSEFLQAFENHGDYLQDHHALFGNHLITEMLALLKLSILLPEANKSPEWQSYALEKLDAEYHKQFYAEGAHKELSAHYQRVVLLNYQLLLDLLKHAEKPDLLSIWKPRVEQMWQYFATIQKPSGFAPLNNDSDLENVRNLLRQNGYTNLPAPSESTHYPLAGQVIFRDTPAKSPPLWAFFDIGPRGTDHQHEDFLHLSLSYGNTDVLVDNGRYTYQPGPWREYFQGPRSHNILLIDGQTTDQQPNQTDTPLTGTGYLATESITAAWGTARFKNKLGAETAQWTRITCLLPNRELLILDSIITFRSHVIEGYWHSSPQTQIEQLESKILFNHPDSLITLSTQNTAAKEVATTILSGATEPSIQGWHSDDFNQKLPAPTIQYTTRIQEPTTYAWLFSPSENNAKLAEIISEGRNLIITYQSRQRRYSLKIELPEFDKALTIINYQEIEPVTNALQPTQ